MLNLLAVKSEAFENKQIYSTVYTQNHNKLYKN